MAQATAVNPITVAGLSNTVRTAVVAVGVALAAKEIAPKAEKTLQDIRETAFQKPEPHGQDSRASRSTEPSGASPTNAFSLSSDSATASILPEVGSASFSSSSSVPLTHEATKSASCGTTQPTFSNPDLPKLHRQAERSSPVSVSYEEGETWNIQLPFPWNIAAVAGALLYDVVSSSGSNRAAPRPSSRANDPTATDSLNATATAAAATSQPPDSGSDDESGSATRPCEDQELGSRKAKYKAIKKLLETHGKEIYKKLMTKGKAEPTPGSNRTAWKNNDFRADLGHLDKERGIRHWELQVNEEASKAAKKLLKGGRGTHEKLFKDDFDINLPPGFEEWKNAVLSRLK